MITVSTKITRERLVGLLCTAFEGGFTSAWCQIERAIYAKGLKEADFIKGGKMQLPKQYFHPYQLLPTVPGCALVLSELEPDVTPAPQYRLNIKALRRGANVMAEMYPKLWADVISENDDAITGDAFVQLCIFGELKYA